MTWFGIRYNENLQSVKRLTRDPFSDLIYLLLGFPRLPPHIPPHSPHRVANGAPCVFVPLLFNFKLIFSLDCFEEIRPLVCGYEHGLTQSDSFVIPPAQA